MKHSTILATRQEHRYIQTFTGLSLLSVFLFLCSQIVSAGTPILVLGSNVSYYPYTNPLNFINGTGIMNQLAYWISPTELGATNNYYDKTTSNSLFNFTAGGTILGKVNFTKDINFTGNISFLDEMGVARNLNNLAVHLAEMQSDTLLDKSRSRLYLDGWNLNYTLYAYNGLPGQFNFNGTVYNGAFAMVNATITLLNGTNSTPKNNYIYFYLNSGTPTLAVSESYPTIEHIDVAFFVVGSVSDTGYNIYAYNRNRYELDTFVKRSLERWEKTGTLYVDGFSTKASTLQINISTGSFFDNIFMMTTTNNVSSNVSFFWINSSGNFTQCINISVCFSTYADGTAFAGTAERVNIVWGIVPINTTGGLGPTISKLVAIMPNYPGAGNTYTSLASAITDNYDTMNYFPNNPILKQVFVPIARTIYRPNTGLFEPFATGVYYQFIAGRVSSGGGAPTSGTSNHASLDNLDYSVAGHTGFYPSSGGLITGAVNITANLSLTGNISLQDNNRICWNTNCSAYTYYNGSCKIDVSATTTLAGC